MSPADDANQQLLCRLLVRHKRVTTSEGSFDFRSFLRHADEYYDRILHTTYVEPANRLHQYYAVIEIIGIIYTVCASFAAAVITDYHHLTALILQRLWHFWPYMHSQWYFNLDRETSSPLVLVNKVPSATGWNNLHNVPNGQEGRTTLPAGVCESDGRF